MAESTPAIHVADLRKVYLVPEREAGLLASLRSLVRRKTRRVEAVAGVSFAIAPGEIVGFLGPNGAGKTTTLKMLIYSFWLILTTVAFWVVRVENILHLFEGFYAAGRWPVGIYPPWLRGLLTFLVPVAFAVTIPAETLVGRLNPLTLAGAAGLAFGFLALARMIWRIGLRNYAGASA